MLFLTGAKGWDNAKLLAVRKLPFRATVRDNAKADDLADLVDGISSTAVSMKRIAGLSHRSLTAGHPNASGMVAHHSPGLGQWCD